MPDHSRGDRRGRIYFRSWASVYPIRFAVYLFVTVTLCFVALTVLANNGHPTLTVLMVDAGIGLFTGTTWYVLDRRVRARKRDSQSS